MDNQIHLSLIVREVRRLAQENPSEIYPNFLVCYYTSGQCGNGHGCIIGQAIQNVAPELIDFLRRIDAHGSMSIKRLLLNNRDKFKWDSYNDVAWLRQVQNAQDHNFTWSLVINVADRSFR